MAGLRHLHPSRLCPLRCPPGRRSSSRYFPVLGNARSPCCSKPSCCSSSSFFPEIAQLRPYAPPKVRPYEVIYYSGDELPRTEDLGGAQAGATGRAGGQEAHHRTQTIHVARGGSLTPRVVDAPDLKLPSSAGAVANLLAFKANPPLARLRPKACTLLLSLPVFPPT